jgi:hypothetical protein
MPSSSYYDAAFLNGNPGRCAMPSLAALPNVCTLTGAEVKSGIVGVWAAARFGRGFTRVILTMRLLPG